MINNYFDNAAETSMEIVSDNGRRFASLTMADIGREFGQEWLDACRYVYGVRHVTLDVLVRALERAVSSFNAKSNRRSWLLMQTRAILSLDKKAGRIMVKGKGRNVKGVDNAELVSGINNLASLDKEIDNEDGDTESLYNTLDNGEATPFDLACENLDKPDVRQYLKGLTEREAKAVALYFGLDMDEAMNYSEIAKSLDLSPQGAKDVVNRSLVKMKVAASSK